MIKIHIRFRYLKGCISKYPDLSRITPILGGIIILGWTMTVPSNLIYWTNVGMHLPDNCWALVRDFLFCHEDFDLLEKLHMRYNRINNVLKCTHIDTRYAIDFQWYKGWGNLQSIYSIKHRIKHIIDYYYRYRSFPSIKFPSVWTCLRLCQPRVCT